jgi:hypothetical protein
MIVIAAHLVAVLMSSTTTRRTKSLFNPSVVLAIG